MKLIHFHQGVARSYDMGASFLLIAMSFLCVVRDDLSIDQSHPQMAYFRLCWPLGLTSVLRRTLKIVRSGLPLGFTAAARPDIHC